MTNKSEVNVENKIAPLELDDDSFLNLSRKKRGIGEILGHAILGAVTGNIVSDFLYGVVNFLNPNSVPNRVGRLEDAVSYFKDDFDLVKKITETTSEKFDHLTPK